ncbi:hypothetical protein RI543_003882 [Arxiozyma heterogenica]|uniref:Mso1 N-terminal domain-containing protein n=2 Tax=Arxiozyma heterogenica TaxID=278026 RepID=A0AAN7WEV0_9SACH|nr:hypothetical protein RI543_003882 [Kazachstania heterogenica]
MSLASDFLKPQTSEDLWSKLKNSTKQLASKTEKDGDTITTTIIHEALVHYYKKQEPFQGFPGWLGHKEDLPDEQKILKKQTEQLAKQSKPSKLKNFKEATSDYMAAHSSPLSTHHHHQHMSQGSPHQRLTRSENGLSRGRKTAGMGFRSIYQSQNDDVTNLLPLETPPTTTRQGQMSPNSSNVNPYMSMGNDTQHYHKSPSWSSSNNTQINSPANSTSASPQSSSDIMSARLKRRTGRNPL